MTHHKIKLEWTYILPVIAVLIWSLNITVTRYVAEFISPISISFYRWLIAFIVLSPFVLRSVWLLRADIRPHLVKFAVLGACGMVFYQGFAYTAAHYTTATNMGIINAFTPVFTIFIALIILKEKPSSFAILGSVVSFIGLLYLISQGRLQTLLDLAGHWGDVLMIMAVFLYAFYGVFLKKWQLKIPLLTSLYLQIGFALIFHLPFVWILGLDPITSQNMSSVLYAGIFPSIIAPFVWMLAVQHLGPNRTSIFMNGMPIMTAIIAYYWLGEAWSIYHSIGGLIIILGIIMAQRKVKPVIPLSELK